MLNKKIAELINSQINKEFFSAYLYLDMANYYVEEGLNGFANWMNVQAQEERDHAMLFTTYLQNNSESVTLTAIDAPGKNYENFKVPLEASLKHEQFITDSIHNIYSEAVKVNDFRTVQFLDWFVKEQGEEEKNVEDLIKRYDLFGNDSKGLYMLDTEVGARVYTAPSLVL